MPTIRFSVTATPAAERGTLRCRISLYLPTNPDNGGLHDSLQHNDIQLLGEFLGPSWGVYEAGETGWRVKTCTIHLPETFAQAFLRSYFEAIKFLLAAVLQLHKDMASNQFAYELEAEL